MQPSFHCGTQSPRAGDPDSMEWLGRVCFIILRSFLYLGRRPLPRRVSRGVKKPRTYRSRERIYETQSKIPYFALSREEKYSGKGNTQEKHSRSLLKNGSTA